MKIIILIFIICNIFSFFLFSMEEQQSFKIWDSHEIRIFFPDIGYKKNQNKKYYMCKGSLFKEKEHDYYTIETCINDQKFKACLQLNGYQKKFIEKIEKNENAMTVLLKDVKGNIQIDIEKVNDTECKKPEVINLFDYHIFSEDEELTIGDEGNIPKYLHVLTLYSNKIYSQESKSFISIYKQNHYNIIETFGEGNKVYALPFFLEEIKQLETRSKPFYLYVNNKTDKEADKKDTLKALIRIAQINDKILHIDQKNQEEIEYRENDHYNSLNDILSDRTEAEKINYIESLVYDIYNFLTNKNNQEVERGEYPSDSYSDQDIITNQEKNTEKIIQENQQLKTQLAEMEKKLSNQNNEILGKIHSVMYCVSFWAIVFLMYYTYKSNRTLIFH